MCAISRKWILRVWSQMPFCPLPQVFPTEFQYLTSKREDIKLNSALGENSYENDLEHVEIWCNLDSDCLCKRRRNK